jgi:DNA-directed RNA polymerase subunit M/transcription elongation factor TFIIS
MKWRIRPKGFLGSGYGGAPDTLTDEKCPSCGRPLLISEVKKQKCRMCGYTFSASGGKKRSYCSKAEKIRKIKLAIEAKRAAGIRYLPPKSRAQMERIHELMARGPLSVKVIDIDLAQQGWISIYTGRKEFSPLGEMYWDGFISQCLSEHIKYKEGMEDARRQRSRNTNRRRR